MSYDYSMVTERLFMGAQINNEADVAELKAAGVTFIIDAQAERDDSAYENFIKAGIIVLWDGTADDGQHKPTEWFRKAIDFGIDALSLPGHIVLTHCAAGHNRGPSLGYAIMRAQGLSEKQTLKLIKKARPEATLAYRSDAEAALKTLGWTK